MKVVSLHHYGNSSEAFRMEEREKPVLKDGQVLIKVDCFGLNFADVMARRGLYRDCPPFPAVLGYEAAGIVEEVGNGADKDLIGKKVVALTRFGGYAEYVSTDERAVAEIPAHISIEESLALATQYCTAWYAACEMVNLQAGDRVLIHAAAGGVGTALTQLCKWKGCTVIGLTSNDTKRSYILKNGADHCINHQSKDYVKEIRTLLAGNHIDVSFNATAGVTMKKDMKLLDAGGRLVLFGAAERNGKKLGIFSTIGLLGRMGLIVPVFLMMRSQTVSGINMLRIGDERPDILERCFKEVMNLAGLKILKPIVGAVFSANDIAGAHDLLESRQSSGKVAVKW